MEEKITEEKMTENLTIEDYISGVEFLAKNKSGLVFKNIRPDLAAIVMAKMIEHAEEEVRIYDHSLTGDIADQHASFLKAVKYSLQSGKKIKIALREETENDSRAYCELCDYVAEYPKNLDIRLVDASFTENVKQVFNKDINFSVGDTTSFRMESTESSPEDRYALCCFNDSKMAMRLVNVFDKKFDSCKKFPFPHYA